MVSKIPLARPFLGEDEIEELRRTFQSGWLAQGPRAKLFEESVAGYSGAKYGVAVNSCTWALSLSLHALGISEGDKVIVPDFTFWSTGNVVLNLGAEPVVLDIDPDSLCIDVGQVEDRLIEGDIRAIIPVHVFGRPAEIDKLNRLAKRYDVKLIEDAASALGSELKGQRVGSFGNLTSFSLQGRKIASTGEGGMITLDNKDLARQLRSWVKIRSLRLSDIQAAVGLIQLDRMENFIKHRIELAALYQDLIWDAKLDIQLPTELDCRHTYQSYVILLGNRDRVIQRLREKKIESSIGTYSLTSNPKFKGDCPQGQFAFKHSLALPMYHELTEDDIEYIVQNLKEIFKT